MARKPDILYVNFYTDGSAARKIAPAFPTQEDTRTVTRRKVQKRKAIYVDPVAILSLMVAACMLVMMVVGVVQFQNAQQANAQMERYRNELALENDLLNIRYNANKDLETVERTALAIGMVPMEQAGITQITVSVPQPEAPELCPWDQFLNFLVDLFA